MAKASRSSNEQFATIDFFRSVVAAIGRKHKPHRSQKGGKAKSNWRSSVGRFFKMGQEGSTPVDESVPPVTLPSRTLDGLAEYIKSGKCRKIVVMTGAGISTSAGIPDFRSPDTGLYANLARLNLPYAEAVFDIGYFRENPEPFYTLAHELYPGKFRPTITHSLIRLLHDKGLLLKLFTQNIDCLEREAGVPDDKIVEAHGSFARQSCIECHKAYPKQDIQGHVAAKTIPRCHSCKGLVKPEIVFFGEQLPEAFFKNRMLPLEADLAIVMGSSLTVQPFASLPGMTQEDKPRVLINMERVGGIGSRSDDVCILGDCDEGVRKLAEACGWLDQLEALWAKTAPKEAAELGRPVEEVKKDKDEALEDEIDKLTKEVDETLSLSRWHEDKVRKDHLPSSSPPKPNGESSRSGMVSSEDKKLHYTDDQSSLGHVFVGQPDAGTKSGERSQAARANGDAEK